MKLHSCQHYSCDAAADVQISFVEKPQPRDDVNADAIIDMVPYFNQFDVPREKIHEQKLCFRHLIEVNAELDFGMRTVGRDWDWDKDDDFAQERLQVLGPAAGVITSI